MWALPEAQSNGQAVVRVPAQQQSATSGRLRKTHFTFGSLRAALQSDRAERREEAKVASK